MSTPTNTNEKASGTPAEVSTAGLEATIVSTRMVDDQTVVLSRYGDRTWHLVGHPTNRTSADHRVDFDSIPSHWRPTMRAIVWRYMCRGREGQKRPSSRAVIKLLSDARPFLQYLGSLHIARLADVTPFACATYVQVCREHRLREGSARAGKPLKGSSLRHRFAAVEALHELSQHTDDAMPMPPWPETSASHLAGQTGRGTGHREGTTPLIPDDVFATLFNRAWSVVEDAERRLDTRDEIDILRRAAGGKTSAERVYVRSRGWGDMFAFNKAVLELRTACYIVVASLSGCRNHELAFVQCGACYRTEEESVDEKLPDTYWWMRSQSTKTGAGSTEWMVPEAVVTAIRVMERWSAPFRTLIENEIQERRRADPLDPEIAEAQQHVNAIFLAMMPIKGNLVRTMSLQTWNISLKKFAKDCGLSWDLTSHHFRRKFANYAARSQFGDLRYLKSHFKHWSMDMTLSYALNGSQEIALYAEIQLELDEVKEDVVDGWLRREAPLAGGYGANIATWRGSEAVILFKDHKQMVQSLAGSTSIRSNGHAWCTADDDQCVGNQLERTRCSGCESGVIGLEHAPLYQGLYDHLHEVLACDDIGKGGRNLVQRDLERCRGVLTALGGPAERDEGRTT